MANTWTEKNAECDICRKYYKVIQARFDAQSHAGAWGNFCLPHWRIYCKRNLGTGIGQMLTLPGEDPKLVATDLGVSDLVKIEPQYTHFVATAFPHVAELLKAVEGGVREMYTVPIEFEPHLRDMEAFLAFDAVSLQ